jgi:hypothetical protein
MAATKTAARKPAPKKAATAADVRYIAEQPADKAALLEKLRALVNKGVPDADVSIKWGVPFYQLNGKNICALASFKDHVAINFFAPPTAFVDPGKKLEGSGKGNRTLKVRSAGDIDSASILRWLKAVVAANG